MNRLSNKAHTLLLSLLLAAAVGLVCLSPIRRSFGANTHGRGGRLDEMDVVATVDGRKIDARAVRTFLKDAIESMDLTDSTPEGRLRIDNLRAAVLDELIDRSLIESEVLRRGLAIDSALL